jgi:hypothetical protein
VARGIARRSASFSFTPATSACWAACPSRVRKKDDSDFDPIRDEPAFKELIGR